MTRSEADQDEKRYRQLYYKYSHIGCPGVDYEDNCGLPDECAENGRCRILREKQAAGYQ